MVASGANKVRFGANEGAVLLIPVSIPDQVDQGY